MIECEIICTKNGFVVMPPRDPKNMVVSTTPDWYVFETKKALFEFLERTLVYG